MALVLPAEGVQQADGIVESFGGQDLRGADVRLDQLDDLSSSSGGQAQAAGIGGRDSAIAGQGHAQGFHQRVHGGGGAHDHAVAGAAHEVGFDLAVGLGGDGPGLVFGGVAAAIGAGAEDFALVVPR